VTIPHFLGLLFELFCLGVVLHLLIASCVARSPVIVFFVASAGLIGAALGVGAILAILRAIRLVSKLRAIPHFFILLFELVCLGVPHHLFIASRVARRPTLALLVAGHS